jgi:hypothetical protein
VSVPIPRVRRDFAERWTDGARPNTAKG